MSKKLTVKLRDTSEADLKKEVIEIAKDEFKLRMQKATGQLAKPHLVKQNRRKIARIKTVLTEKAAAAKGSKA